MKRILLLSCFLVSVSFYAQNNVGINTNTPDSSAILHLESSDKGFLLPRLSITERNNIVNPATGLVIYNVTDSIIEQYNGVCWIPSYSKDCSDCSVDYSFGQSNYQINRANALSINIPFAVTSSNQSGLTLSVLHDFSEESSVIMNLDSLNSTGNVALDIQTSVFEDAGSHTVTFFSGCGSSVGIHSIVIDVSACDEVLISADQMNFDVSADPAVSGNNCVVVIIEENVGIRSIEDTIPAFTTGTLTNTNLGILNYGYVYGDGGDAPLLMGEDADNGGDAIFLTCNTEIRNHGMIYGGGGAGLTVGAFESLDIGGVITICLAIGAGGGGGMPDGQGGLSSSGGSCSTVIGFWQQGNSAGPEYDDFEGAAVSRTEAFNIPTPIVSGTIVVTANSGGGGDFGEDGTTSSQPIDFTGSQLSVSISIPFIGNVTIPIPIGPLLNPIANSINGSFNTSLTGVGGYAIRHNGNLVNIPDDNYQTYWIRGMVGN
ncbi:MAG: hypothetical protein H6600_08030 [Flavobacteriales bacterium]|nr:hypothetical protein [Flavobacteriales bacterium]MCB9198391.1 hypothetical protein [Flavobacteriales bacterium]